MSELQKKSTESGPRNSTTVVLRRGQDDPDVGARRPTGGPGSRRAPLRPRNRRVRAARSSAGPTASGTSARSVLAGPRRRAARYSAARRSSGGARGSWRTDLDERQVRAAARPGRASGRGSRIRASSARRARGRCRTGRPGVTTRATDVERARRDRASRMSDCRIPYGAITMRERARPRTAGPGCRRGRTRDRDWDSGFGGLGTAATFARAAPRARASAPSGRCRPACTPARASGSETRPVPQPSSSTGPRDRGATPLPERHVAPAERLRVLPVVERRVLVPASQPAGRDRAFEVS